METALSQKVKKNLLFLVFLLLMTVILILSHMLFFLKPSNTRNWEFGFEILPQITIHNQFVTITNLRDFEFSENQITPHYLNKTVDINQLERVWFVFEPFKIRPFTSFDGVAHTYFVFDFTGQEPIVVSVEARREKNEKYDAFVGMLNQYELIYVWGTERDETVRRVIVENNPLYMYPLTISPDATKKLFLETAQKTQNLETNPRFYNTFTSNCTNELAKVANQVKPNSIPFNLALFLPGYSIEELYKLGYIPNNQPLEQIKQKYYVSDLIRELQNQPNFSQLLRQKLL